MYSWNEMFLLGFITYRTWHKIYCHRVRAKKSKSEFDFLCSAFCLIVLAVGSSESFSKHQTSLLDLPNYDQALVIPVSIATATIIIAIASIATTIIAIVFVAAIISVVVAMVVIAIIVIAVAAMIIAVRI